MRSQMRVASVAVFAVAIVAGAAAPATAQVPQFLGNEASATPTVKGAPFSGEGLVTLKLTLFGGTKIERTVPSKYYRDSQGRVRREQTITGLAPLTPAGDLERVVTIVDPVAGYVYSMIGSKREVQRVKFSLAQLEQVAKTAGVRLEIEGKHAQLDIGRPKIQDLLPPGFATKTEVLGTRDIDGIAATGKKTTTTIPVGFMGNDRPIEVTDEQWEAVDLKVLLLSKHHDPRTGEVEYRLSKITRAEPAADLFTVPQGYRIVDIPSIAK